MNYDLTLLLLIILANVITSVVSLIGAFSFRINEKSLEKISFIFVSLSAGALLGDAFIHILPEALEGTSSSLFSYTALGSIIGFFLIEKVLHWRHCHEGQCDVHQTFGYMNLLGDSVHNFIDGLIIAATFLVDVKLGFVTTFAVMLHELPQEIGDFGVLIYSGYSKKKALFFNFVVSLTAILGGVVGYFLSKNIASFVAFLLPVAAGGFIYIALSDLLPEMKKETNLRRSQSYFVIFLTGILIMFLIKILEA